MENILGTPPPDPPADVPQIESAQETLPDASFREQLELHRTKPICASCHQHMDPLGFGFENFDAIGRWRETDGGAAINAVIKWNELAIDSPRAFREALAGKGTEFVRTVTEKLFSYALGRGVNYYDAPTVRQLVRDLERDDYRWSSLVFGIIRSAPFQQRRVSESVAPAPIPAADACAAGGGLSCGRDGRQG